MLSYFYRMHNKKISWNVVSTLPSQEISFSFIYYFVEIFSCPLIQHSEEFSYPLRFFEYAVPPATAAPARRMRYKANGVVSPVFAAPFSEVPSVFEELLSCLSEVPAGKIV